MGYPLKALMEVGREGHVIFMIKCAYSWEPVMRQAKLELFAGGIDSDLLFLWKNVRSPVPTGPVLPCSPLAALKWLMGGRSHFNSLFCSYFMPDFH